MYKNYKVKGEEIMLDDYPGLLISVYKKNEFNYIGCICLVVTSLVCVKGIIHLIKKIKNDN